MYAQFDAHIHMEIQLTILYTKDVSNIHTYIYVTYTRVYYTQKMQSGVERHSS